ncbi:MAG: PfkB family carbohydrate kinase [Cyclobacteriaceae bacterium]
MWINSFEKGQPNRVSKEESYPGGKGVHVAMGVKELGIDVAILAFWAGEEGKWVKQQCESKGIACYGPMIDGSTRTCLTLKTYDDYNETEFLGVGPLIKEEDFLAIQKEFNNLLDKVDVVSFSGSWPISAVEVSYNQFIFRSNELKIPSFIDCSGQSLINALDISPFCVHINHFEGHDLYRTNPTEAVNKIIEKCQLAVVSCGADGLYLTDGRKIVHALSRVDKVLSSVGSGDCLMAGLIVAFSKEYDLLDTAKLAAACGAANCVRIELGMFHKRDVDHFERVCETRIIN